VTEDLKQDLSWLGMIYEGAPIGLCYLDRNLRHVHINEALAKINGLPVADHLGRSIREVLPDLADHIEPMLNGILETGQPIVQATKSLPIPPGTMRHFEFCFFPDVEDGGDVAGVTYAVWEITELRMAQQQVEQAEQRYFDLYNNAPDMIASVDAASGKILECNNTLAMATGYSKQELRSLDDISGLHHPDSQAACNEIFTRFVETGQVEDAEVQLRCKDGSTIDVSLSISSVRDGDGRVLRSRSIWRDITRRKQAERQIQQSNEQLDQRVRERTVQLEEANQRYLFEITERKLTAEALRESEERLRVLLESTNAIPWMADAETWDFTYVGPQAVQLLGFPLEDWYEPQFWADHIHPDDLKWAMDYCTKSSQKLTHYEFDYRMVASDGREVWLHDIVSVESHEGKPFLLRGFMIDITERKLAQNAIEQQRQELATLTGRLLEVQETERRKIARELHDDVTQRLAALAMEASRFEQTEGMTIEQVQQCLRDQRKRIVNISRDIHGLSRQLHPSILDDLGLIKAIGSECNTLNERQQIDVEFKSDIDAKILSKNQALCLYRVVQESLRNTAKHAQTQTALVDLSRSDGVVRLTIADQGIGFERKALGQSAGIGLACMEERVRLCRGQFVLQTDPGKGTTVLVELPLEAGRDGTAIG